MKKLCTGILCVLLLGLCACGLQTALDAADTGEPAAGYFDMVWGWKCPEGKYSSYIDKIYHTERGTAGSSGKAAISAVSLLEFSKAFSDDVIALTPAFDAMNDSQARYFASQWIRLRSLAGEALSDPDQFREEYGWAGLEDFDAVPYSFEDLNALNGVISSLLCLIE
jgi:hypothetical protein